MYFYGMTRFNGFRATDTLAVLDDQYRSQADINAGHTAGGNYGDGGFFPHSGTNEWGTEIVFEPFRDENNSIVPNKYVVVKIGGKDNIIPENGIILTGHGAAGEYLGTTFATGDVLSLDLNDFKTKFPAGATEKIADTNGISQTWNLDFYQGKSASLIKNVNEYEKAAKSEFSVYDEELFNSFKNEMLSQIEMLQTYTPSNSNYYTQTLTYNKVIDAYEKALSTLVPKQVIATNAVWVRPNEKNLDEIHATLNNMKEMGINSIYLEIYDDQGRVIYDPTLFNAYVNSNPEIFEAIGGQRTEVEQSLDFINCNYGEYGSDLLQAYIGEAAKVGIEVNAWVREAFVAADATNPNLEGSVLETRPDWANVDGMGNRAVGVEGANYRFIDLGNPEVRRWLREQNKWLATMYDGIGQIQFDYIRFPVHEGATLNPTTMNGLNPGALWDYVWDESGDGTGSYIVNGTKTYRLRDLLVRTINANKDLVEQVTGTPFTGATFTEADLKSLFDKEDLYHLIVLVNQMTKDEVDPANNSMTLIRLCKINSVTQFVYQTSRDVHMLGKMTSQAIFSDDHGALIKKSQDWLTWVENGWIDTNMPMAYFGNAELVNDDVAKTIGFFGSKTQLVTGISPTEAGGNFMWSEQIRDLMYGVRQYGFGAFAYGWLDRYEQLLFKLSTALPNGELAIRATDDLDVIARGLNKFITEEFLSRYPIADSVESSQVATVQKTIDDYKALLKELEDSDIVTGTETNARAIYDKFVAYYNNLLATYHIVKVPSNKDVNGDGTADVANNMIDNFVAVDASNNVLSADQVTSTQRFIMSFTRQFVNPLVSIWGTRITTHTLQQDQIGANSPERLSPEYVTQYTNALLGISTSNTDFLVNPNNAGHLNVQNPVAGTLTQHRDSSSFANFDRPR